MTRNDSDFGANFFAFFLIFLKIGVDKQGEVCYNIVHGTENISCRCGGIGRRPGLKIP